VNALSIREPWASAIVHGEKRIENRTWAPPARYIDTQIAIHAAKTYGRADQSRSKTAAARVAQYEMEGA